MFGSRSEVRRRGREGEQVWEKTEKRREGVLLSVLLLSEVSDPAVKRLVFFFLAKSQ